MAGAPFAFWLLGVTLLTSSGAAGSATCPATQPLQKTQVVYVYDGDTVKLQDGRRLRLIGIDTPERGHHEAPSQPLADAARTALQQLVDDSNRTLWLQDGQEDHDHYGRLLAHAFLENGDNVAVRLLQQGLAATLVVPPNTRAQACYQRIEDEARSERRGLWATARYQPLQASTLPLDTRGFHIVQGRISGMHESRHTLWVDLDGPLTLQINRRDLGYFDTMQTLIGKDVEVRGWIKADRDGLRLQVQHPAALQTITAQAAWQ